MFGSLEKVKITLQTHLKVLIESSRFFYNPSTNKCEKFIYGGCEGNENNFHVKLACEAICKKPPKKEVDKILKQENHTINSLR